jgi:8-oxo-dGTP diphosphatase
MTDAKMNFKTAELEKISHLDYFKIGVSVDCVIFGYDNKELKVLVIQSDLKEFEGLYSLLGDLVNPGEDIDAASYRILKDRTGMDDVYLEQVQAFGNPNRHPSGRVITIAYYSLIDIKHHKLQLDNNDLHWHSVAKLKKLAFDHKGIMGKCLLRLQEQIMEYPVIFNLLPVKFSLRELQELYESILGIKLDRRNFRKKIAAKEWLADTNEMEKNASHRPGKLYSLKKGYKKKGTKTSLRKV